MGDNKEVFGAETFAVYQALRVLNSRQEAGRRYAIFSDSQSAIRRISSDELGPGQQWARGVTEVCVCMSCIRYTAAMRPAAALADAALF